MTNEILRQPDQAEAELRRILEIYQESPLATLETFAYYGVDGTAEAATSRSKTKKEFLAGEVNNPDLFYPVLEKPEIVEQLGNMETTVLDLMKDSLRLDYDGDRELALYDNLRLRYLEVAMLQISHRMATERLLSPEEKAELSDMFNLANEEVYGYMQPERFNGLAHDVLGNAVTALKDDELPKDVREAAEYLITNSRLATDAPVKLPVEVDSQTLAGLRDMVVEMNADILETIPDKPEGEKYTIEELVYIFEHAHATRGTGWQVITQTGKRNIDTRQSEKITYIGEDRPLTYATGVAKILLHENGVHVERRRQGDLLSDPLLSGTGLAGYLDSEEGLATILEQIYEGKTRESGVQYYLTLGWARGLDGKPRDFRDVYELEWRRRVIQQYKTNPDALDIEKIKDLTYNTCERIFRGTPCDIPGMVYTKDQAYFVGNQKIWEYLDGIMDLPEEDRKQEFAKLFAAKFDPTNELHRRIVDKAKKRAIK